MNLQIHSYGCKVNTYDTGLLQKEFRATAPALETGPRVHVLNTCAVTAEATKEAVRQVRRLKAKDPFCTVVVTGCAAQVDTGAFQDLPGVDLVIANSHKMQLPRLLEAHFKGTLEGRVFKSNIFRKDDLEAGGGIEKNHTRAFVKIQDGCNSFCSYCIIPYARGKSRSLSVDELVRRVNELSEQGVAEVVLTGVHIGDYEDDSFGAPKKLEDLLEALLARTRVPRFRLTSFEPVEISERLLELYADPRLCAHFHMSIQSAEDHVLRDMKRSYGQAQVVECLHRLRERVPGCFIGMDVIVGFPTETSARFEETVRALSTAPWTRIHVFPYSERPGTRAAVMSERVEPSERARRAKVLRELSRARQLAEAKEQMGAFKKALVLNQATRGADALSRDYWPVRIVGAESFLEHWRGREIDVRVIGLDEGRGTAGEATLVAEVNP